MPELRTELPNETLSVLDGYCSATGMCRTQLVNKILGQWADEQVHVSTLICRVAGVNPTQPDSRRQG